MITENQLDAQLDALQACAVDVFEVDEVLGRLVVLLLSHAVVRFRL